MMPVMTILRESPPLPDLPERLLARLWRQRAARQQEFRTDAGLRVRVLYPGRPGLAAGPDFRDALLEVEGLGRVRGDVELHRRQQDWYAHGHAADPNYNGVVLHAALELSPGVTRLQNGGQAPVISLAALLTAADDDEAAAAADDQYAADQEDTPAAAETAALWAILERQGWLRPADAAGWGDLLDAAGDARFQRKSAWFRRLLAEQPPEQTLYEGLMEALGYRANRQPFLKLAAAAPWAALAQEAAAFPPAERAAVLERRLLQRAGLAPADGQPAAGRTPAGLGYGAALTAAEWHCFRVRPANHPRRRIAGAARLLAPFIPETRFIPEKGTPPGLAAALTALVAAGRPAALTAALTVAAAPGEKTASIGPARARDLAVNVVLPFCHALTAAGTENTPALALYHAFGKLQDNEITRETAARLSIPANTAATARRQQGLLHLHRLLSGGV